MVSFQCEGCGDVLTKKKLDSHYNQCYSPYSCIDCQTTFHGYDYRSHTSCISEAQKYMGHLYREKDNKKTKTDKRKSGNFQDDSQAMIARSAYVEDGVEGDESNAIAVIDVPPPCPTPPPVEELKALPANINVFDYLVTDATPRTEIHEPRNRRITDKPPPRFNRDSQHSLLSNGDGERYLQHGYSYGNAPIQPGMERYESWAKITDSEQPQSMQPPFVTPAPKESRRDRKDKDKSSRTVEKSDKKRKRNVEELDLSATKRPVSRDALMSGAPVPDSVGRTLHSGLTGGLSKLVTDSSFYDDRIDAGPTPISPIKRSKREKDFRDATEDRRKSSYTSYASSKISSIRAAEDAQHHRSRNGATDSRNGHHHGSRRRDSFSSDDDDSRVSHRRHRSKPTDQPERPGSVQPTSSNAVVQYRSRAEHFMSFINKGPESTQGCSMNKALKRYHRDLNVHGDEKDDEDKELWKMLRLRRNSRGEIVLFTA